MRNALYIIALCTLLVGCSDDRDWQTHAQRVEDSYAYLKTNRSLPADVDLEAEARILRDGRHLRYAGEAYYILGAYENLQGADSTAMRHLKEAELCWQEATDAPAALVGMTYYKQGRISENESLPEVALHHYRRALPLLIESGDSLYISSVYREIARMTDDTAEQRSCFAEALRYAESLSLPLRLDTRYAQLSTLDPSSDERYRISRQLCDSAHQYRYAADVVRHALCQHDMPEAKRYLDLLAQDTTEPQWSRNQHALLTARYLYLSGQSSAAYNTLEALYQSRLGAIEQEGAARSFTIAERFDNAAQREANLRLRLQKQHLRMVLVVLIGIVLIGAVIAVLVVLLRSERRRLQAARTEAQIASMQARLSQQQDSLRHLLLQRIAQAAKMQNIFAEEADWLDFRRMFDSAYDGLLTRLEHDYPQLTTADLQVVSLTALGMDISDICLLLNQTKRTVWNRRQRIKDHMNMSQETSLDDVLRRMLTIFLCALTLGLASCVKGDDPDLPDNTAFELAGRVDTITPPNNPLVPRNPDDIDIFADTLYYVGVLDLDFFNYGKACGTTTGEYFAVLRGATRCDYLDNTYCWRPTGNVYFLLDGEGNNLRYDSPLLHDVPVYSEIIYVRGLLGLSDYLSTQLTLRVDSIQLSGEPYYVYLPD